MVYSVAGGTLVWNDVNGSSILTSQSSLVYDNINGYPMF